MSEVRVSGLFVYPLKSAGGFPVESWPVDGFGPRWDRRWMVVDPAGGFLTQRSHPRLALVRTALKDGALRLSAPGLRELSLPAPPADGERRPVVVWRQECAAADCGEEAAGWISEHLGTECRIVFMPDDVRRPIPPRYATEGRVSFADSFPFLLVGEASLSDLNTRLPDPVPMNRFRPNLVVSGTEPYEEDCWRWVRIGGLPMRMAKTCGRCPVPTVDQETATKGAEPLRTLAAYRKYGSRVVFGVNLLHVGSGEFRVGDAVHVVESGAPWDELAEAGAEA